MTEAVMDFPTAWEFVRETDPADHHEQCSWRTQNGALLCDCRILWDEYDRRKRPWTRRRTVEFIQRIAHRDFSS